MLSTDFAVASARTRPYHGMDRHNALEESSGTYPLLPGEITTIASHIKTIRSSDTKSNPILDSTVVGSALTLILRLVA
jgi:hypothetical protein